MNYKEIIRDAWRFTQTNKPLMWWYAFVPEFIGLLVGICYVMYQVLSFWKSPIFREYHGSSFTSDVIIYLSSFLSSQPSLGIILIVLVAIIVLFYFTLPIFSKGALVQLIARKRNGQMVKPVEGISFGFLHFLPLFEYHLIIRTFSLFGLLTEASFVIRNLGTGAFEILLIPFILILAVGLLLLLLFTYSEYFIIIDEKQVIESMGASSKLVIRHWQHTILMLMLMVLITLRIFLNIILVLLIPSVIIISTGILAAFALAKIGLIVGCVMALIGMYFSAYLGGILQVFSTAVWVFTFLELTTAAEISARESAREPAKES
ncbi:MAG: hypothetical protein UT55_C0091G0004 [Candidatus Peregrinibacteria bacterium GW2011_GWE2_39_6]|nr:MAG: hypothetical protein UT36_C0007G0009 [Candidatus Peregrinibacteria bacterium GW2011_GWF2_39_17]KKR23459.1 MAG: hypothetical protein UT55_C0091G0004 [Candidatus Peregrinibacteria bacterium GW2011_GWE2_39_6]HCW31923.1 hypothetical protein [Candidatus Peregrinibacteria bacterium]